VPHFSRSLRKVGLFACHYHQPLRSRLSGALTNACTAVEERRFSAALKRHKRESGLQPLQSQGSSPSTPTIVIEPTPANPIPVDVISNLAIHSPLARSW
jgi:hypothetical protein